MVATPTPWELFFICSMYQVLGFQYNMEEFMSDRLSHVCQCVLSINGLVLYLGVCEHVCVCMLRESKVTSP